ncbi:MAG: hypothetical protein V2I33_22175 [Kangiellaceae bacterium]|jgi:cell division septal protein FtsQ|nr:hypothetical protein [Kangiellaceae bacterium]
MYVDPFAGSSVSSGADYTPNSNTNDADLDDIQLSTSRTNEFDQLATFSSIDDEVPHPPNRPQSVDHRLTPALSIPEVPEQVPETEVQSVSNEEALRK